MNAKEKSFESIESTCMSKAGIDSVPHPASNDSLI